MKGTFDVDLVTRVAATLRSKAGLVFADDHLRDVEAGIETAMAALQLESAGTLLARMVEDSERGRAAFDQVVQAVTIGETYFFRYPEQFRVLREHVLPELIAKKREAGDTSLRLWSAACSTGEEAYSLAMTIADLLPDLPLWRVSILASDINQQSLEKARRGVYGAWSFRGVDAGLRDRHFDLVATDQGPRHAVKERYKKLVHFTQINLKDPCYPSLMTHTTAMDAVFCRNVLIYFSQDAIREVALRLHETLVDGGCLFLGPAEPNETYFGAFKSEFFNGTMLYRRDDSEAEAAPAQKPRRVAPKPRHSTRFKAAATRLAPPPSRRSSNNEGPDGLSAVAFGLWRDGRIDDAASYFRRVVELDTNRPEAYFMLAVLAADKGSVEEASQFCAEALRKDAMDVRFYHLASILEGERGEHERAIEHLKKAIFLDRKFVMGHFGLGVSCRRLGRRDEAARYLRNCLELLEHVDDDATVPGVEEIAAGWLRRLVQSQVAELQESGQRLRNS